MTFFWRILENNRSRTMTNHDKTMTVKHHKPWWTMTKPWQWNITTHHEPWWNITTHHDTSWNIKKYYEPLQSTINHHNLYKNYCKVSKNIINYVLITIVVKKYEINLSNSRRPQKMIWIDFVMTPIHIANMNWFKNCISGTPKVSKYIANLVGIILNNEHDITYTNIWECLLLRKKYYSSATLPQLYIINN